jgi:hypothetical protein
MYGDNIGLCLPADVEIIRGPGVKLQMLIRGLQVMPGARFNRMWFVAALLPGLFFGQAQSPGACRESPFRTVGAHCMRPFHGLLRKEGGYNPPLQGTFSDRLLAHAAGEDDLFDCRLASENSTGGFVLRGQLQYSAKVAPLDPVLWPGNNFDKDVAQALLKDKTGSSVAFHKIPKWLAGEWQSKQSTCTRAARYVDGQPVDTQPLGVHDAAGRFTQGTLRDKNGDIWGEYSSNYWTQTNHGRGGMAYSFHVLSDRGNDEYPDLYTESVDFVVDPYTRKIASVQRRRAWDRYVNVAPGIIKDEQLHTVLNERGEAFFTAWNVAVWRRIEQFSSYERRLADRQGREQRFRAFCKKNGLGDLLPSRGRAGKGSARKKGAH